MISYHSTKAISNDKLLWYGLTWYKLRSKFLPFKVVSSMRFLNIAGYKFITLQNLLQLRQQLLKICEQYHIKGTILLSTEGINISLAGAEEDLMLFLNFLANDKRFSDIRFHRSISANIPFRRLKVKLKKEIITFKQPSVEATLKRAQSISPELFKEWLDQNKELSILDTRNDYEIEYGTFQNAINLHISDFNHLPTALNAIDKKKPVVMFCTGGVRCEKAALWMEQQGYESVYQLDGGILGYFAKVGGAYYEGKCFVFDERVALDTQLQSNEASRF